jgi:NAD(P)H-flavin reductase
VAIVRKVSAEVMFIKNLIPGVYTLGLKSFDKPFKYESGQFLHLALDEYDPAEPWPDSRCFSMQSAPGDDLIKITYAVKGKFTMRMEQELKPGKLVTLKLPFGNLFTQPHNRKNTVFIAGGTGITPFLSLFGHKSFSEYINPRIYLGFRSLSFNIYSEELSMVKSGNIKILYEDTDGKLDVYQIYSENGRNSDYFISGPPLMIKAFKNALIALGVSDNQILTDDWE